MNINKESKERKIIKDTFQYILHNLLGNQNHEKSRFIKYIQSLPEHYKYYGFDQQILYKIENDQPLMETTLSFTIPELIIMSGKLAYLIDIKDMGYDLTKPFFKSSGYFNDFQYLPGMHCPLSTLLQLEKGMDQLNKVINLNIFNTSEDNLFYVIKNSLLTMNVSTIANNFYFSPYTHNISKMINDEQFQNVLKFLLIKRRNPETLYITNQFFDFILPHWDFSDNNDEQNISLFQAFMNNEHYNQGYIFNQLCAKFPEYKRELSISFLKLISSYIKETYKEKEIVNIDSQLIIHLLRNPNIDLKNIDIQSIFTTPKMQQLTKDIFQKQHYNNISFLIKNTNLYNNNYILEYIAQHPNIPEEVKQSLYNDCIIKHYDITQKTFDQNKFKENNKNNYYIQQGKTGYDALNVKIEQGKIQTIFESNKNIDSDISQNNIKKRL